MILSDDVSDLVRGSAQGSLVLMVGQVLQTLISFVTVVVVADIIGRDANGEVFLVGIPVSVALLIGDIGVSTALTRYCAMLRHEERMDDLRVVVRTGLAFSAVISLILSAVLYLAAGPVSVYWLHRPDLEALFRVSSLAVVGQALITTTQSIFVGYELMRFRAGIQVAWSIIRGLIAFPLVFAGYLAFGAVAASTAASLLIGVTGVVLVFYLTKLEDEGTGMVGGSALRLLFGFGLPIYASTLVGGGLNQLYSTLMAAYVSVGSLGDYSVAVNFAVLVSFFTLPIGTTLFPMFSKMRVGDSRLELIFRNAVKYTNLIVSPVAACLIVVARPLTHVIYPDFQNAGVYLGLFLIIYLFEGLGGTSLSNLLVGLGEVRVNLYSTIVTFVVGAPLSLLLIHSMGLEGAILARIIAPRAGWLYQILWLRRTGISVNWRDSVRVYVAVAVAFVVGYSELRLLDLHGWIALVVCTLSFILVYLVALPLSGVLRGGDFDQLGAITSVTGPLAPILRWVLSVMRRIAEVRG